MAMNLRPLERIDYTEPKEKRDVRPKTSITTSKDTPKDTSKVTPEVTPKDDDTIEATPKDDMPEELKTIPQDITQLEIDIMVAIEDIDDLIDENASFDDVTTSKLEQHRTNLRRLRNILMRNHPQSDLLSEIKVTLDVKIKSYIKSNKGANNNTKVLQDKMKQDEIQRKQRSIEFLVNNINRDLKELTEQFSKDTETATDEDISKWKKEIPHLSSKVDKVADNIKTLMQTRSSDASYETTLKNISEQFETLFDLKKSFILDINDELAARDIEKSRDFNRSRLNIKIEKFSGYDSKIDFFTFRTNFEKLHLKTTPKQFLPELLKNNFLTDHALNLVRNLDDIDIIWERLKGVYGNPKMMLSKRLLQLQTLDVSKSTKPEKAIDSLTKVINVLQDLMRLAQEHNIEEYLYYGEGLNTIYQLIGDVQTTKFLDTICTDDLEQQEIWSKLISFLDHQKRIHQQRLMIQGPTSDPTKRDPPKKDSPPFRRGPSSHHTDGQQNRRPPDQSTQLLHMSSHKSCCNQWTTRKQDRPILRMSSIRQHDSYRTFQCTQIQRTLFPVLVSWSQVRPRET
ncbi:coiled-coil domain-containing protein 186-like [Clytia hemisphaerica]|uniref:coiled-coil domain-containing protein 186-like n=1 Tax=Clytia hemisphaerica TaxID=252671 RepID=UPI0034D7243C